MSPRHFAIISPSGAVAEGLIDRAADTLRTLGMTVTVSEHARDSATAYGVISHSAPLDIRERELRQALNNPDIDVILCARGGYGAIQLLGRIEPELVAKARKPIIGFSDITALHALWAVAGVPSFHAPMTRHITLGGPSAVATLKTLELVCGTATIDYTTAPHPLNRNGQATGTLRGGNLALLYALRATPYDVIQPGVILAIEDVAEQVYQVQRMLHSLRLSGQLAQLGGLVVGQFTKYNENTSGTAMYNMIADMVAPYNYPVCFNFPIGHVDNNLPLPLGDRVTLTVDGKSATLRQPHLNNHKLTNHGKPE